MSIRCYLDWTLVLCSKSLQRNHETAFFLPGWVDNSHPSSPWGSCLYLICLYLICLYFDLTWPWTKVLTWEVKAWCGCMFACRLFERVVFQQRTGARTQSVCSMHLTLYRMASLAQARGTCGTTLGFLNEHTGQQWLSRITETADTWPNNVWCNTMRLWAEAWYWDTTSFSGD